MLIAIPSMLGPQLATIICSTPTSSERRKNSTEWGGLGQNNEPITWKIEPIFEKTRDCKRRCIILSMSNTLS